VKLLDRLLLAIYDPRGSRRREQVKRIVTTNTKILESQAAQRRAAAQVRLTQSFVRRHRGEYR
jgi:hypothetical protein